MGSGYHGKILRVDLTKGAIGVEAPPERLYREWFGGAGLATYLLLKNLKPGADPLRPENVLVAACSVLNGHVGPGLTRTPWPPSRHSPMGTVKRRRVDGGPLSSSVPDSTPSW